MGITTRLLFEVWYLSLVYFIYRTTPKVRRRRFSVSVLFHGFSLVKEAPWPLWLEETGDGG